MRPILQSTDTFVDTLGFSPYISRYIFRMSVAEGQFERIYKVRRAKLMGFKTCLIADEAIPKGAFLFLNHSEMIDIKKLEESGKVGRNGAGKIFLISLSDPDLKRTSDVTLKEAETDSKPRVATLHFYNGILMTSSLTIVIAYDYEFVMYCRY